MYSKTKIYLKKFFGSGWSHHVKNTEILKNSKYYDLRRIYENELDELNIFFIILVNIINKY